MTNCFYSIHQNGKKRCVAAVSCIKVNLVVVDTGKMSGIRTGVCV